MVKLRSFETGTAVDEEAAGEVVGGIANVLLRLRISARTGRSTGVGVLIFDAAGVVSSESKLTWDGLVESRPTL